MAMLNRNGHQLYQECSRQAGGRGYPEIDPQRESANGREGTRRMTSAKKKLYPISSSTPFPLNMWMGSLNSYNNGYQLGGNNYARATDMLEHSTLY